MIVRTCPAMYWVLMDGIARQAQNKVTILVSNLYNCSSLSNREMWKIIHLFLSISDEHQHHKRNRILIDALTYDQSLIHTVGCIHCHLCKCDM